MKAVFIFSIFLFLAPLGINAGWDDDSHEDDDCCICPNITVTPTQYDGILKSGTDNIFALPLSRLSKPARCVQDELKKMINSKNKRHALLASSALILNNIFSNIPKPPSFCAYARLINATAAYDESCDKSRLEMLKAYDGLAKFVPYFYRLGHQRQVKISGCESEPIPPTNIIPPSGCYKDGFVHNIEGLWCALGDSVPCTLPDKVIDLYYSKKPLDKMYATIVSYVMADTSIEYYMNQNIVYKSMNAGATPNVPKCCCCERLKAFGEIEDEALSVLTKAINFAKKPYLKK